MMTAHACVHKNEKKKIKKKGGTLPPICARI